MTSSIVEARESRWAIQANGKPVFLLLKDWTGYPWIRVGLNAEVRA